MDAPNVFALTGEVALITGGGTGLGLGMARCLAAAGAKVVLAGRREAELARAAAEIGVAARYVVHDVTRLDAAPDLVAAAGRAFEAPVSILINNAGIHLKKPALETTPEEFQAVLTTHVCAAHALNRAVLTGMLERRHGSICSSRQWRRLSGCPW